MNKGSQVTFNLQELETSLTTNYLKILNRTELLVALYDQHNSNPNEFGVLNWAPSTVLKALYESSILAISRFWDKATNDRKSIQAIHKFETDLGAIADRKRRVSTGFREIKDNRAHLENMRNYRDAFVAHNLSLETLEKKDPRRPFEDLKSLMDDTRYCLIRFQALVKDGDTFWNPIEKDAKRAPEFWQKVYGSYQRSKMT